jgi:hypothetical protein
MTDRADPRRQKPITIRWNGTIGSLTIDGETWGAIEWSVKHGVWCIEDAEGKCLRHASSIHGKAAAKDEAIALAERLVRDGTLPAPEEAKRRRHEERERRAKRPSEIRRKEERKERDRILHAKFETDWENRKATPFYQIFAEAFDLADPDLWKSNSFAMVRPRLLIEVRAAVANLEHELHERRWRINRREALPPKLEQERARAREKLERELARAREILALLVEEPHERGGAARRSAT